MALQIWKCPVKRDLIDDILHLLKLNSYAKQSYGSFKLRHKQYFRNRAFGTCEPPYSINTNWIKTPTEEALIDNTHPECMRDTITKVISYKKYYALNQIWDTTGEPKIDLRVICFWCMIRVLGTPICLQYLKLNIFETCHK